METQIAYPQVREMVPDFVLESADGTRVQLSDFRGRRNLLLVLLEDITDSAVSQLLRGLAAEKGELEFEEVAVLVIARGDAANAARVRESLGIPFQVLADSDGVVHDRYAARLVLTDRYGEIYSVHRDKWPAAEDVMASLRHINAECPE